MIVDTSALLAVLFAEAHAPAIAAVLGVTQPLVMSTVNLCEVLVLAADRKAVSVAEVTELLMPFAIDYVAPDTLTTAVAATARLRLPLNFGDCFAYALAKTRNEPLLTLDSDFARTDAALVPLGNETS